MFAKLLANRLKQFVGTIVQPDQTYCVPGRSISVNINLTIDILNFSNLNDTLLAFNNVDHVYLFSTMRAMGFGDRFISYLELLYSGAESLVKVCVSLTAPFLFEKGIHHSPDRCIRLP